MSAQMQADVPCVIIHSYSHDKVLYKGILPATTASCNMRCKGLCTT